VLTEDASSLSTPKRSILGSCYILVVPHDATLLFVLIGASYMQSAPDIELKVIAPPSIYPILHVPAQIERKVSYMKV